MAAGQAFGWIVNTRDNLSGRATAIVDVHYVHPDATPDATPAVPLPAAAPLLAAALGTLAFARRARRRRRT